MIVVISGDFVISGFGKADHHFAGRLHPKDERVGNYTV
jgi:hypothetical protein